MQLTGNKNWIKFQCLEARQPGTTLYTIVIKGKELVSKSKVLARASDAQGIQRILNKKRCDRIAKFLAREDSILPGNIIGTIDKKDVKIENGYAYINPDFLNDVIDGQHRLWGFHPDHNLEGTDFDVILTFMVGADNKTKASLFYKINKEQKKIDPSLAFDLLEVMEISGEEEKERQLASVCKKLNDDSDSPFFGIVKIKEKGDGVLTLATMIHKMKKFLGSQMGKRFEEDGLPKEDRLYQVLKAYFASVKKLFPEEWGNKEFILTKSLGYGALTELLPEILIKIRQKTNKIPDEEEFGEVLKTLEGFDFKDQMLSSLGGEKGQKT